MEIYQKDAFKARVNFAASYISAGRQTTRSFDTCFEMQDGDAVAAALVRRADKNPRTKLARNLFKYISEPLARECEQRLGKDLAAEALAMRQKAEKDFADFMASR